MGTHPDRTLCDNPVLRQVRTLEESVMERSIRDEVFVREQSVPVELEFENEGSSVHFLLWVDRRPVGCGRYRRTVDGFKLERIAVLRSDRGKGNGRAIVDGLVEEVRTKGGTSIYLNSQTSVRGFYERSGFKPVGDEFLEAGIWHIKMVLEKGGNVV